jgi:hypothetical protein
MSLERLGLPVACLLLVLGLTGTAGAQQTYLLGAGSGGQVQIGGGLPLPIQLTDANFDLVVDWGSSAVVSGPGTMGPGAGVFPPLLIPPRPGVLINGTTVLTMGQKITVPAGALSRPAVQKTLGVNAQNPGLYAVATNLGFKWPAANATFMRRLSTVTGPASGVVAFYPVNSTTVYAKATGTRMITYKNTGMKAPAVAPFGGFGPFNVTPAPTPDAGLKPTVAVTVYALAGAKVPPPCTGCIAAILAARPGGPGAIGAKLLTTVTTTAMGVAGKNVYAVKAGAVPKGTIIGAPAPVVTSPMVPTNMALSLGFFWTTGMIAARAPGAAGTPEHFFLSGMSSRTTGGAGVIQMVSGSLSTRMASGPNANRGWVRLNLVPFTKTPSISEWGLVALGGSLLAIGAFAGLRRRARLSA